MVKTKNFTFTPTGSEDEIEVVGYVTTSNGIEIEVISYFHKNEGFEEFDGYASYVEEYDPKITHSEAVEISDTIVALIKEKEKTL